MVAGTEREQAFWDEHVPSFDEWRREYESPPDPNTAAMLDALEPLDGCTVLDFACGAGVTSARLAARGATVTGLDISPMSIQAASEYCRAVGLDSTFVVGDLESADLPTDRFDRIAGPVRPAPHGLPRDPPDPGGAAGPRREGGLRGDGDDQSDPPHRPALPARPHGHREVRHTRRAATGPRAAENGE